MRKVFFLILTTTIYSCAQQINNVVEDDNQFKVDSVFNYYIKVLDTYLVDTSTDSSVRRVHMMHYLEGLTGIMSSGTVTYLGTFTYKRNDVKNWREWYSKNRKYLFWDARKKQIIYKKE